MDPYIGKLLDDRYEILDVLGTGGMAVVYRAYCHRLNRYVAVKILKSELAADQDLRRRFHDESQAVAMLSHPNIVSVYDVSQVDGREFIVMELIDGITLKQYMHKRGGSLNWREALHFITQILQGLKHAHSRGIIHRDIKPQNVMVLRDGSVKVTDFGIARSTNSQVTMTQETIGSVHYISPEQARGSHIDARSDIYSAGVVLYEMLTGRLPFEGDNPVSVAIQHIKSIPIAPRELNPSIPLGMEQITLKAMASVPDRRYSSAEAMLQDLEAFRKNPEIDFGYSAPGVLEPSEDEPTVVKRGGTFLDEDGEDSDATVRSTPVRRPAARFEREEEQEPEDYDDYDDEDYDEAAEKKKNKVFIGVTAGIAGVLVILFVVLWFTLFRGLFAGSPSYQVPDLIGKTVEEAQAMIDGDETLKAHFTIAVGETVASEEEIGTIIDQSPDSTHSVKAETTEITVTLSGGPAQEETDELELEDYTDGTHDYRQVKSQLEALGLKTNCQGEYNDEIANYMVIRTDPEAGTKLEKGDTVTIYYSQGPETKEFEMVNLLGQKENDAKNAISNMGLVLGSSGVTREYNDEYDEGEVCYQSIPAGMTVKEGDSISIVISLGPEPEPEPEPEQPTTPSTPDNSGSSGNTGGSTTGGNGSGTSSGTTDNTGNSDSADKIYNITVTLPEGRTADALLQITVNGQVYEDTVSPSDTTYVLPCLGTIYSCSATVDGVECTYNISEKQ